jgi:glutamyl-tRNA reductase
MSARRNRPLFLIDIAVPRDIDADVDQLENVYLYNVDHLDAIVRENVRQREQELSRCQAILQERTTALMARLTPAPERANHRVAPASGWALGAATACPAQ